MRGWEASSSTTDDQTGVTPPQEHFGSVPETSGGHSIMVISVSEQRPHDQYVLFPVFCPVVHTSPMLRKVLSAFLDIIPRPLFGSLKTTMRYSGAHEDIPAGQRVPRRTFSQRLRNSSVFPSGFVYSFLHRERDYFICLWPSYATRRPNRRL